ncbi:Rho GDP-dissociation inhibitor 2 [Dirofilaria immitis]|nr:Rho GDP-dissociation inhibitor 2 [Dirofilaria immitis]
MAWFTPQGEYASKHQMDEKEIQDLEMHSAQENYVPPPQKSVSEIIAADANDESLNRYKQVLLGQAKSEQVIVDATDSRNVLVRSITLVVEVDRETFMMGSYAPKMEMQSFITPLDEAPSGMLHRGTYKMKSQVCDDDGHDWLSWTWSLEIAKDWGE